MAANWDFIYPALKTTMAAAQLDLLNLLHGEPARPESLLGSEAALVANARLPRRGTCAFNIKTFTTLKAAPWRLGRIPAAAGSVLTQARLPINLSHICFLMTLTQDQTIYGLVWHNAC